MMIEEDKVNILISHDFHSLPCSWPAHTKSQFAVGSGSLIGLFGTRVHVGLSENRRNQGRVK